MDQDFCQTLLEQPGSMHANAHYNRYQLKVQAVPKAESAL